jgi:hypothetical protein
VIKQQVEMVIFTVDDDAFLASYEREADAKFEDERFDFPDDRGFKVLFC